MKYSTRSSPSNIFLSALMAAGLMFAAIQSAQAVGTQSGTVITNNASLTFSVGGVAQTAIVGTAAFTVDDKVNLTVAGGIQKAVTPGQVGALTPFTITNNGNATQGYNLTVADAVSGAYTVVTPITDNFNAAFGYTIFPNPSCDGATIVGGAITTIPTLAAGATYCVLVSTNIAATQVNGDAAVISLKAVTTWPTPLVPAEEPAAVVAGAVVANTAGANTAGVDVVFADVAGAVDAATDGAHSTYGAYKVLSAVLSVAKAATLLCDPVNGNTNPKNIPGAVVQYAVTITNAAGAASATLTQVSDALAAQLAIEPKLINGVGAGALCTSATGTSLAASGFGAVSGAGVVTTYAAPGLAAQATTAGATATAGAGGTVTINYGTLASPAYTLVGGVLPANSFVTVYFNTTVQ